MLQYPGNTLIKIDTIVYLFLVILVIDCFDNRFVFASLNDSMSANDLFVQLLLRVALMPRLAFQSFFDSRYRDIDAREKNSFFQTTSLQCTIFYFLVN